MQLVNTGSFGLHPSAETRLIQPFSDPVLSTWRKCRSQGRRVRSDDAAKVNRSVDLLYRFHDVHPGKW